MKKEDGVYRRAEKHLVRRDPILKQLIRKVGACALQANPNHFFILTKSIVSQQLSTKAAATIHARLLASTKGAELTPLALLALSEEALQAAGLSRAKRAALRDLATKVHTGELTFHQTTEFSDEEVIKSLVRVKGIGRWTAEMFLIFSLGRLDVLPVADLGLRAGIQEIYGLEELPDRSQLEDIAKPWQPYRSVATWYLWRSRAFVVQEAK
jgi:DNA-3-methyladenine glycosylase II